MSPSTFSAFILRVVLARHERVSAGQSTHWRAKHCSITGALPTTPQVDGKVRTFGILVSYWTCACIWSCLHACAYAVALLPRHASHLRPATGDSPRCCRDISRSCIPAWRHRRREPVRRLIAPNHNSDPILTLIFRPSPDRHPDSDSNCRPNPNHNPNRNANHSPNHRPNLTHAK